MAIGPVGKAMAATGVLGSFAALAFGASVGEIPIPASPGVQTLIDAIIVGMMSVMYRDLKKGRGDTETGKITDAQGVKHNVESLLMTELKQHRADFNKFAGSAGARLNNVERGLARSEERLDDLLKEMAK